MKGWMLHAAACPRGCDSRPTAAARCSLSVYIMNSQQRRDHRAVNTWLQYQNTAAQVSRSIFTSRMADTVIPVTNWSTFFHYLFHYFETFYWIRISTTLRLRSTSAKYLIIKLHDDASDLRDTRILLWKWFHALRRAASTSRHFRCNRGPLLTLSTATCK